MKLSGTILLLSSVLYTVDSLAESSASIWQDARWEFGLGAGGFAYQLYPGSDDSDRFVIPLPYFTFTSPLLEIDRGIKGFLYRSDTVLVDISADFALPVNSSDSGIRQGMPDLDPVLQLGPSLEFLLGDSDELDSRIELPLRVALATDVSETEHLGWVLEPRLSFEHRRSATHGLAWRFTTGVTFVQDDFHDYYYSVPPGFAAAQRPVYDAEGGFSGWFASTRGSYRFDDWVAFWYLRYTNLNAAVIDDSPLVETGSHLFIGAGFAYIIASQP